MSGMGPRRYLRAILRAWETESVRGYICDGGDEGEARL